MDQTECVATVQHCGEQLLSVINDVLDYTKLEATGTILFLPSSFPFLYSLFSLPSLLSPLSSLYVLPPFPMRCHCAKLRRAIAFCYQQCSGLYQA